MSVLPTIEHLSHELAAGRTTAVALAEAALARARDPAGEGEQLVAPLGEAAVLAHDDRGVLGSPVPGGSGGTRGCG